MVFSDISASDRAKNDQNISSNVSLDMSLESSKSEPLFQSTNECEPYIIEYLKTINMKNVDDIEKLIQFVNNNSTYCNCVKNFLRKNAGEIINNCAYININIWKFYHNINRSISNSVSYSQIFDYNLVESEEIFIEIIKILSIQNSKIYFIGSYKQTKLQDLITYLINKKTWTSAMQHLMDKLISSSYSGYDLIKKYNFTELSLNYIELILSNPGYAKILINSIIPQIKELIANKNEQHKAIIHWFYTNKRYVKDIYLLITLNTDMDKYKKIIEKNELHIDEQNQIIEKWLEE